MYIKVKGLSLIELLFVLAITAIIAVMAYPSYVSTIDRKRTVALAEQIFKHLQLAKVTSITVSQPVTFKTDSEPASWVYGFGLGASCDPTILDVKHADACKLIVNDGDDLIEVDGDGSIDEDDLILHRYTSADHRFVSIKNDVAITFDPVRGTSNSGTVELESDQGAELEVRINILGDVQICAPTTSVIEYKPCS